MVVMIAGYLASEGVRVPRRPAGVAQRRCHTIRRRLYAVPYPNYIWHVDGNHKLIQWRFVVHGGVDGYSRMITFLRCSSNNRAVTVAESFLRAINMYGIPNKLRSDLGGENVDIWRIMVNYHDNPSSVVIGSSTHNERIERLWRDVHTSVLGVFAETFRELEEDSKLDRLNDIDLFCIYLPRINQTLNSFVHCWNNHRISTESGRTLMQLHVVGLLTESEAPTDGVPSLIPSTLNPGMLLPEPNESIEVPESSFEPCDTLVGAMEAVNPLDDASSYGKELYVRTVDTVGTHLSVGCDNCVVH